MTDIGGFCVKGVSNKNRSKTLLLEIILKCFIFYYPERVFKRNSAKYA